MTDQKRPEPPLKQADHRRRADMARLSVALPRHIFVQLKIHAAQHQATMRDVVAGLIQKELGVHPL